MNKNWFMQAAKHSEALIFDDQGRIVKFTEINDLFEPLIRLKFIELGQNTFQLIVKPFQPKNSEVHLQHFVIVLPLECKPEYSVVDLKFNSSLVEHLPILQSA